MPRWVYGSGARSARRLLALQLKIIMKIIPGFRCCKGPTLAPAGRSCGSSPGGDRAAPRNPRAPRCGDPERPPVPRSCRAPSGSSGLGDDSEKKANSLQNPLPVQLARPAGWETAWEAALNRRFSAPKRPSSPAPDGCSASREKLRPL